MTGLDMYCSLEFFCWAGVTVFGGILAWFMFGWLIAAAFVIFEMLLLAPTCFLIWRNEGEQNE